VTLRSVFWTVLAISFVGLVTHAASRQSSTCPVVGSCESIHLQMMKGPPPLTAADALPPAPSEPARLALARRSH